jgi:hypothetical protein
LPDQYLLAVPPADGAEQRLPRIVGKAAPSTGVLLAFTTCDGFLTLMSETNVR